MTYKLVGEVEVGSGGASSISFTGIPNDGVNALVILSLRNSAGSSTSKFELNSDTTTSNYDSIRITANGVNKYSYYTSANSVIPTNYSPDTTDAFGNSYLMFPDYASSSHYKSFSTKFYTSNFGTYVAGDGAGGGVWQNNNAITSIELIPAGGGSWVENSTASLYIQY